MLDNPTYKNSLLQFTDDDFKLIFKVLSLILF